MPGIERLIASYEKFVRLPQDLGVAGPQKVWFAVYASPEERRLRARIGAFQAATIQAGYTWRHIDLSDAFAQWMAAQEYREEYFKDPSLLDPALDDFVDHVVGAVRAVLTAPDVGQKTVVAVTGVASLFGAMRLSVLVEAVAAYIRGRLLVFFPGERDGPNYRLLDARDGWNYLAVPITAAES